MKTFICENPEQLEEIAKEIVAVSGNQKIWVFKGIMGAGKTALIKSIAKVFEIGDSVSSPTFSIVNEYQNPYGEVFYHFDFYRIDNPAEAIDIGVEEYFYSGHYCWIEWAERIGEYIPVDFLFIEIDVEEDGKRVITMKEIIDGAQNG